MCDQPDCDNEADWFVGLEQTGRIHRGHATCDKHLAQGCKVTWNQLHLEEWNFATMCVSPVYQVAWIQAEP